MCGFSICFSMRIRLSNNILNQIVLRIRSASYKLCFAKTDIYFLVFVQKVNNIIRSCRLVIRIKRTFISISYNCFSVINNTQASVYKGYKRDEIEMRGDRAEMSDFPLYLNTVAGGLDRRDQTIGGFSFVVKIYAVPVVEIIG